MIKMAHDGPHDAEGNGAHDYERLAEGPERYGQKHVDGAQGQDEPLLDTSAMDSRCSRASPSMS